MKPSIGRIVHYVRGGIHFAAIITAFYLVVFEDGSTKDSLDLTIFLHNGHMGSAVGAKQSDRCEDGTWHWPERVE